VGDIKCTKLPALKKPLWGKKRLCKHSYLRGISRTLSDCDTSIQRPPEGEFWDEKGDDLCTSTVLDTSTLVEDDDIPCCVENGEF
jgi:hypothetical protein